MKEFSEKVAVITGAASGIGRSLVDLCGQAGMRLFLADLDSASLTETAEELRARGWQVATRAVDVARAEDMEALAQAAYDAFGAVHLLCNNAGVAGRLGPIWEQSSKDWEWVMRVNLDGVMHGVRAFVPRMLAAETEGHIVNVASMAGMTTVPLLGPYHVSKFGVVALTEVLYQELVHLGADIGVSLVCPGFLRTRIMDSDRYHNDDTAESERDAGPSTAALKPVAKRTVAYIQKSMQKGPSADDVATMIMDAVRANRLYVFTHGDSAEIIFHRTSQILRGIADGKNPTPFAPR